MTTPITKSYHETVSAVGLPGEAMESTATEVSATAIAARQVHDAERAQFWATVHGIAHQARSFYDSIPARVDNALPTIVKVPLAPTLIIAGQCHGVTRLALDTVTGIPEALAALFDGQLTLSSIPGATKAMLATEWDRITEIPTHVMNGALMSAGSNTGYVGGEVALLVSGVGSLVEVGATVGRLAMLAARITAQGTRFICSLGEAAVAMSRELAATGAEYMKRLPNPLEGLMPELAVAGMPNSFAMVAARGPSPLWGGGRYARPKPTTTRSRRPSSPQIKQAAVSQDPKAALLERSQLSRYLAEQFGVPVDKIEQALHQLGAPVRLSGEFQYLPSSPTNLRSWPRDARKYIVKGPATKLQIGYVPPGGTGLCGEVVPQGRVFIIELPK